MRIFVWICFIICAILTFSQWLAPFIISPEIEDTSLKHELYNPELNYLNTIEKFIDHIDSIARTRKISNVDEQAYILLIDECIRKRFHHGGSRISFSENFIAYLAYKIVWEDFGVDILPNEIMKYPKALCSQNAIVFQEIAKRKGFSVRAIGLKDHFCSEVFYSNSWHFIDSDYEPVFDKISPLPSLEELSSNPDLAKFAYKDISDKEFISSLKEQFNEAKIHKYGINEFPAKKMKIFHLLSYALSQFLWLILLVLALMIEKSKRNAKKSISMLT